MARGRSIEAAGRLLQLRGPPSPTGISRSQTVSNPGRSTRGPSPRQRPPRVDVPMSPATSSDQAQRRDERCDERREERKTRGTRRLTRGTQRGEKVMSSKSHGGRTRSEERGGAQGASGVGEPLVTCADGTTLGTLIASCSPLIRAASPGFDPGFDRSQENNTPPPNSLRAAFGGALERYDMPYG